MKIAKLLTAIYQVVSNRKRIELSHLQHLFISDAFKDIGSGVMLMILIAGLIEGGMHYLQVVKSIVLVIFAWYIGLKVIQKSNND